MSVSQNKVLAGRVDALEQHCTALQHKFDATMELLCATWAATGQPVPRELRGEPPRPDLSVIQGGAS